jgi:2-desacetyl-2-hydroxyethyl bacteriochlorophyllide A dehydrogenase
MSAPVSIVIRTYNEERHLPALFDALDRQKGCEFETVVVDSGSVDRTRDIAAERADKLLRIASHDFTFGYSLNVGIEAATGSRVAMISAHTVPLDENFLAALVAPLAEERTAMSYGRQVGASSSKFSEAEDLRRRYGAAARDESLGDFRVNNANAAIRRDLWLEHRFNEELTGLEDIAWARHWMLRGWRVAYAPEAALLHIHDESWKQIRTRFYREAVAIRRMSIRGRRHLPATIAREIAWTGADAARAFAPNGNPAAARLGLVGRLDEIVRYRFNKSCGIVRGAMAPHPLESRQERQDVMFDRTADAVVIHGPDKARLERIEIPALRPGDVLVRVAHVAVCATDLEILHGKLGYFANGMSSYPIVPGHEFSGEIVAAGPKADGLKEGDRVVVECIQSCGACAECRVGNFIGCPERSEVGVMRHNGAYANYMVTPARFVHRLPANADMRAAALTEPLAVVLKGLRRIEPLLTANGAAPKRFAVLGAGPLGHMCVRVLAHRGHAVTAYDRNPARRALLEASQIATKGDLEGLDAFDAIVEVTGDPVVLERGLNASRANAVLLLLGLPYGPRPFSFETVAAYDKTVIGSVGSTAEDFDAAIALLPKLDLAAYFAAPMKLAAFAEAWRKVEAAEVFKVILDVDRERSAA